MLNVYYYMTALFHFLHIFSREDLAGSSHDLTDQRRQRLVYNAHSTFCNTNFFFTIYDYCELLIFTDIFEKLIFWLHIACYLSLCGVYIYKNLCERNNVT